MSLTKNWTTATLAASALAFGLTTTAVAQDDAEGPAINSGAISLDLGIDTTSAYYFRGIAQENKGLILQPWATITVDLYEDDQINVAGYVGTWNSVHSHQPGGTDSWYEADVIVGVSVGLPAGFTVDLAYINLYNPRGGASFAQEIDLTVAYDDSEFLDELALNPYATIAWEFSGGSDGVSGEGTYLELGIEPSLTVLESEDYPVSLSLPVTAGFSLNNYYQDGGGNDPFFGFVSVGIAASTSLSFLPAEYGDWSASLGFDLLLLGDEANDVGRGVTGSSLVVPIVYAGISMSY
ncbi:MAG: hypothetical protein RLN76_13370 [Phycisphaeraceae bacterium]